MEVGVVWVHIFERNELVKENEVIRFVGSRTKANRKDRSNTRPLAGVKRARLWSYQAWHILCSSFPGGLVAVLLNLFLAMRRTAPIVVDELTLGFWIVMMPWLNLFPARLLPDTVVGVG